MYRFARRPMWIVSHVAVALLIVGMVSLGFWQLRRLDEVQARNAQLAERLAIPPAELSAVVPADASGGAVEEIVDRQVVATGRYRADEQVLIWGRSLDDAPGAWVVVPFETVDGRVVAVNRGWISDDGRLTGVPEEYRSVPEGEVQISGILHPSQERGSLGALDPEGETLTSLARIDLDRLDDQVEGDLEPVWVQLTAAEPGAPDPSPRLLAPPVIDDEGPHLSYAVQWFTFATIALVGYPLIILRKVAREQARRHPDDAPGLDDPDPDDVPRPGDPRLDAPSAP